MDTKDTKDIKDIEDIKKEVLNRIKAVQEYKRIPEKKINQWINEIPTYEFEPRTITEVKEEIDRENLFDRKVSDVITYLSQYKDYTLEERWSGYEDNYFVFSTQRPETSDEIATRICNIVRGSCCSFLKQEEQIADIDRQIRRLENQKRKLAY